MKKEILKLLASSDDFLSGEQISKMVHVSRAAVWKHIKAIKEEGAVIEAHTKKGYRLKELPDLLKPEYVGIWLQNPYEIIWKEELDSTNEQAKRMAREGAVDEGVFVTEKQTKGKGRIHRGWTSERAEAIMMSVLLRPELEPSKAPIITFAAALGVVSAVKRICNVDAKIKWPNDIVYDGKKMCGILTEMSSDMDRVEYIVCGMGLNVNQKKFEEELSDKAVSIRIITGKKIDRVKLSAAMIEDVFSYCGEYIAHGIDAIFDDYCANSVIIGKEIKVFYGNEMIEGICEGFTKHGELILNSNGEIRNFIAGEVSIRGTKGYI